MGLIIVGMFLAAGGIAVVQSDAGRQYVLFGGLLQIAAGFFVLIGMKQYFLKDILAELKKISASKA